MDLFFRRGDRGPVKLVICDWAGTVVDFGCMAPAAVFVEGFRRRGVEVTMAQARAPMGMEKRTHIAAIAAMPEVADRWRNVHGAPFGAPDLDGLYADFVPLLLSVLDEHSTLIPGVLEMAAALAERSIALAGTTGYFDEAMRRVVGAAARQGYHPATSISATQVAAGRPAPWMIFGVMAELGCYPPETVVNVGDTVVDVQSGLNAGVWSVGVARSGNEVGMSLDELTLLERTAPAEAAERVETARQRLAAAGAHVVVDSVAELPAVVDAISDRLRSGERP